MAQLSHGIQYCHDRGYPTKHATPLPRLFRLSDSVPRAYVNYATTDQIQDMKSMVKLAEERGDDVGKGEYFPDDENVAYWLLSDAVFEYGEIFRVETENENNDTTRCDEIMPNIAKAKTEAVAFISVYPSLHALGYDPCLAGIGIFRAPSLATDDVAYRSLVGMAVSLAEEISCGYTHAVIDMALCHVNLLRQLKEEGFTIAAIIPENVEVAGVGLCENVILVKRFMRADRPVRQESEVIEMLERTDNCIEFNAQFPTMSLPLINFLPQQYTFKCGIQATLRNARKEDDQVLFTMITDGIKCGEGYPVHEFPSLNYFRKHYLMQYPTVVIEDSNTLTIIGFCIIYNSLYPRGGPACGRPSESFIFLNPEYRGKGIGSEYIQLDIGIARELGYTCCIQSSFISNQLVIAAGRHIRKITSAVIVGVIPNAGYVEGIGWEDIILTYIRMDNAPTFTELVRENSQKRHLKD